VIIVDTFEPTNIFRLIKQALPDSEQKSINKLGLADYLFFDIQGRRIQFERKQWGELLGSISSVEEQLRKQYENADELNLIVEGVIQPTPYGLDFYKKADNKPYFKLSHHYGDKKHPRTNLYSQVIAWFWQLDKSGITVYQTPSDSATASLLVSIYYNAQKEEHTTLQRYIKPRIQLVKLNPFVKTLMGIEGGGLGADRAEKLIHRFGTPFDVFMEEPEELAKIDGIGEGVARKLFKAIGKE